MQKQEDESFYKTLKDELELRFGRAIKYSKDCRQLSDQIFEITSRRLSESTIKRFFGIISRVFKPSQYTLDTFSIFLGYEGWEWFLQSRIHGGADIAGKVDNNKLKECFDLVTRISIAAMEEKTGYSQKGFIHRPVAEHWLMNFIRSDKKATIIVGPKGYGKSSLLVQFHHDHFTGNDRRFNNANICILDGSIFFSLYNQSDCNLVLKPLIEFDVKAVQDFFFNSDNTYREECYVVIIDDFDKIHYGREKFYQLAGNLMHLIMINNKNPRFKMILTCTPENIDIVSSFALYNPVLADAFYDVKFKYRTHFEAVNVPVFTRHEIKEIILKNKGIDSYAFLSFFYPEVFEIIKIPAFLSYLLKQEEITADDFSVIRFLNKLVRQFIFSQPFAEEKQHIVRKFLRQCNIDEEFPSVLKNSLLEDENLRTAYQELINSGLFQEFNEPSDTPDVLWKVRFSYSIIFEYILARFLAENKTLDLDYLNEVFITYKNSISVQYALLKWIIRMAFFENNNEMLMQVHAFMERKVNIPTETAGDTMPGTLRSMQNAFSEGLRAHRELSGILIPWLAQSKLGQRLYFGEYFDMDNLMHFPENSLDYYLENVNTPDARIMRAYIRFIKGFYSLDYDACTREFEQISLINYSDIKDPYFAGYYFSAYFLYASLLKGKKIKNVLGEVISYAEGFKDRYLQSFRYVPPFEFLLVYDLNTCDFFDEVLALTRYLSSFFSPGHPTESGYYQLLKLCHARALLHTGDETNALKHFSSFRKTEYPFHMRHFMRLNENLALTDFLEHQQKTAEALQVLHETKALARQMGFHYYTRKAEELESKLLNARKDMRSD